MVEERIVAFAIPHPGLGSRRIVSWLRRRKRRGLVVSTTGGLVMATNGGLAMATVVWAPPAPARARHGAKRLSLVAGHRGPVSL